MARRSRSRNRRPQPRKMARGGRSRGRTKFQQGMHVHGVAPTLTGHTHQYTAYNGAPMMTQEAGYNLPESPLYEGSGYLPLNQIHQQTGNALVGGLDYSEHSHPTRINRGKRRFNNGGRIRG